MMSHSLLHTTPKGTPAKFLVLRVRPNNRKLIQNLAIEGIDRRGNFVG